MVLRILVTSHLLAGVATSDPLWPTKGCQYRQTLQVRINYVWVVSVDSNAVSCFYSYNSTLWLDDVVCRLQRPLPDCVRRERRLRLRRNDGRVGADIATQAGSSLTGFNSSLRLHSYWHKLMFDTFYYELFLYFLQRTNKNLVDCQLRRYYKTCCYNKE